MAGCRTDDHQGGAHAQPAEFSSSVGASPTPATQTNQPSDSVAPDHTEHNTPGQGTGSLTPLDQGEDRFDLELTRKIRRAVMGNAQLSMNAKNVKIITINGKVTLRGPVETREEKQTIEDIARRVGAAEIDDQLDVNKTRP